MNNLSKKFFPKQYQTDTHREKREKTGRKLYGCTKYVNRKKTDKRKVCSTY